MKSTGHDFASQAFLYMLEIVEVVREVVRWHFAAVEYTHANFEAPH